MTYHTHYETLQGVPKNALSELPPIGVELSKSLPPEIWRQFWKCGFWDTLYVSIIKININRSAPWGRRRSGGGGVWLGWQGVGWHLQVGAELVIRMVTLKQRAYYMSIKYGLFDQIIHQGATMTVRSLSLFVTRTTMLLVNIDTQTYSSECWKILIFLYDIWYYKIFSVYWTSTVHWLDLQITRFQSIAISAFRRSSRRVYFLLVGLADHCGPTSMSPCIGKDLLSSISRTTVELPGWFESRHSYRLWETFHGVVIIAENNASFHFSSVSTLWLLAPSGALIAIPTY